MSYNYNDEYSSIIYHNKIQYRKNQQMRYNFRENISLEDLDQGVILNFPYNNVYFSYKSPTTNIPLNRVFKRAGVIPYTYVSTIEETDNGPIEKKEKYYCLAIDSEYGNLTDFGGGVKKYETFTHAASRELYEESLGLFRFGPEALYECSEAVYDFNMIILLINVKINDNTTMDDIDNLVKRYYNNYSNIVKSETKGMFWIHESRFYDLIKSGKSIKYSDCVYPSVYKKVADLLRSVSNINEII
jgi:hypothetical protein